MLFVCWLYDCLLAITEVNIWSFETKLINSAKPYNENKPKIIFSRFCAYKDIINVYLTLKKRYPSLIQNIKFVDYQAIELGQNVF